MENQNPTPKLSKRQAKQSRGFARHGRIRVQTKASAIWGILFKILGLVLGATVAVSGIAIADLSNTIKANGIVLSGAHKISEKDLAGPINMLLVGSDTRAGQGEGYGNETSVLADVIILLHVSADRKHATALSFPRDLLVPWPACPSTSIPPGPGYLPQSLGQINATIANGGPGCTLLTVEALTGLKIPYLAMIDFKGVIEMSNAIGGVEVCVTKPIHDSYTYLNLAAGKHVLQGKDALKFLRTRHGVGDGSDLSRISNQQVFLTSLVRKVKSAGVLGNPIYLYSLASAAARNMKLSESLTNVNVMVAMAGALKNVELDKMTFLQVPSRGGLPAPYSGRVAPIYETANLIFEKLQKDEPIVLAEANGGQGAVIDPTSSPSPSPSVSASPNPSALPTGILGTTADTKTCSN
ncbi:LCP family protein [Rhodoluna sp.]|uniref:LCP family protein n=1 Tax=Rhodoluna sp. TaxID=1969481 RepID=UPI0025F314C7|nr:LCP family protein [Rhodoluna sp.]